jgi:hypothetical protein
MKKIFKPYFRFCAIRHGDLYYVRSLDRLTVSKTRAHVESRFAKHEDQIVKVRSLVNKVLYVLSGKVLLLLPEARNEDGAAQEGKEISCNS